MPAAQDTWEQVSERLDRYASAWLAMRRDACEATHVRGEQSAEVLDLRMACLDDRRDSLAALTNLLATGDRGAVTNAVNAVRALPTLDGCADVRLLRAAEKEPVTPAGKRLATDLRRRAAAIKAMYDLGDQRMALERGKALIAEARAGGQPLLLVEMLNMVGEFASRMGFVADGAALLRESGRLAISIHREDLAAEAFTLLTGDLRLLRPQESLAWADVAEALVGQAGRRQNTLQSWILNDRANALVALGNHDEAERLFHEALTLKEKILAADDPDVLITWVDLAEDLHKAGRTREALEIAGRVCAGFAAFYGPDCALEAMCLNNQGEYLLAVGKAGEAIPIFNRSLSGYETRVGPGHQYLAYPLTGLGRALLMLGRPGEAQFPLERALAIRANSEDDPAMKGETRFALAQALWSTGERARAERLAMTAKEDYRTTPVHAREIRAVESWISTHGQRWPRSPNDSRTEVQPQEEFAGMTGMKHHARSTR
jgi:tetratricopeptide (TPR) repeat protein